MSNNTATNRWFFTGQTLCLETRWGRLWFKPSRTDTTRAAGHVNGDLVHRNRQIRVGINITVDGPTVTIDQNSRGFEKRVRDRRWPSIASWETADYDTSIGEVRNTIIELVETIIGCPDWEDMLEGCGRANAELTLKHVIAWKVQSVQSKLEHARQQLAEAEAEQAAVEAEIASLAATAGLAPAHLAAMRGLTAA